jgi:signal transduction histidine kinase
VSPGSGGRGDPGPGRISLRARLYAVSLLLALVGTLGFLILLGVSLGAQGNLVAATDTFMEEERIADAVTRHAMDQLAAAFALRTAPEMELREAFQESGRAAHGEVRRYLFRDLAPEERLQLETMAEAHQRMEVAGLRAADLFARGQAAEAEASWAAMLEHSREFLAGIATFLQMRQGALDDFQAEQARTFSLVIGASVVLALLLLALAGLLAWMVDRRITRPLARLATASEGFGSGRMDVRVPLWSDRELYQVASGFNQMADRIQETTAELEGQNQELNRAMGSLRRTQDDLVQAEKMSALGRMSAGLAHELNNPLTSVIGYAQLLEERLEGGVDVAPLAHDELRDDFLQPIVAEANRARELVRNLLHFTRRAGSELKAVDLPEALDVVLGLRRGRFQQAGLRIQVDPPPGTPALAEASLVQAVFLNIVNNALDAMEPRGRGTLWIRGSVEGGEVRIVLEDDGPGLPDAKQVFEPFFTTKPPGEGTGLGLALVHRFMEHFGGRVEAGSRPGGGARFTLTFQAAEADPDDPESPASGVGARALDAASGGSAVDTEAAPRILVVEDEAPIRDLHRRLLVRLGLHPLLAESASMARELMEEEGEIGAVLCDVKMPGETGLEFYRWLQGHRPELAQRLLFVTGDVGDPELLALLAERPDLFLHKPFSMEEYGERVLRLLAQGRVPPG